MYNLTMRNGHHTNRTDTMENATPRKPHDIVNRGTRYEIAARHADGRHVTVAFAARTTKRALVDAIQSRGDDLLALMGDDMDDDTQYPFERTKATGRWVWRVADWTVGFTGRTEREIYWENNR